MKNSEKTLNIIYSAIDDINQELPKKQQIGKDPDENIFGDKGKLDSLGLVNLIVAIEGKIYDELEENIVIANEKAMSMKNSPFRTVGSLNDFIMELLDE